jgi:4'-phosphopantetheinyl transferase
MQTATAACPGQVDIWRICLATERPLHLTGAEQERAGRFHFETDRWHWSRAHSALRTILSRYIKIAPLDLEFQIGEHGKPSLGHPAAPHFNLSHSGDWALVAVSIHAPVGVDVERIRENVDIAALLRRLGETDLPKDRDACFRRWSHREARSKAHGAPLMMMPPSGTYSADVEIEPRYVAAVALIGHSPGTRYYSE